MASEEDWWADGYLLTEWSVRNIEYRKGMGYSPPKIGSNVKLLGGDGAQWAPKSYDVGSFMLNMWLTNNDHAEVWAAYERLLLAVSKKHRLVKFERLMANGESRLCYGEVLQAIEPEWLSQNTLRVGIEVNIPGAFWEDYTDRDTGNISVAGYTNVTVSLTQFTGATAPMSDLVYIIHGPISDVFLIDAKSWQWFFYSGSIGDGEELIVDSGWVTVTPPGGVANLSRFFYTGWRFLDLMPADEGAPEVVLQASSAGAGSYLEVMGKRKFLV